MKGLVHGRREDAVAVVYEEPIGGVQRETVPKLLYRPSGRRVCGDIPVHHAARRDVEQDKDVQPLKRRGHDQEEVAGEHGTRMIVEEGGPGLRRLVTTRAGRVRHVPSHRAR